MSRKPRSHNDAGPADVVPVVRNPRTYRVEFADVQANGQPKVFSTFKNRAVAIAVRDALLLALQSRVFDGITDPGVRVLATQEV